MQGNNISLPEWCWHTKLECVVKIVGIGHFPTTAMAKLPDDTIIEVEINELEVNPT